MGEIADMHLNGTLCENCGVFLNNLEKEDGTPKSPPGHPRYCSKKCADESNAPHELVVKNKKN